jgi:hypothetical protein
MQPPGLLKHAVAVGASMGYAPRAMAKHWVAAVFLGAFCLLAAAPVEAQGDVVAAANAFEQAQRAELSGESARAAELYELADRMAPAPEALRNATRMRLAARQNVAAASHAEELLRRYPDDVESKELAEEVLRRTRPELGRVVVKCSDRCTLVVDGLASATVYSTQHVTYVAPGEHTLEARFEDGAVSSLPVSLTAGESRDLEAVHVPLPPASVAAPATDVAAPRRDDSVEKGGLSPIALYVLGGSTVAVGAVTLWSGLDLLSAEEDFKKRPTAKKFEDGESKDLRTSVLIGATSALAVATVVVALFTDFDGPSPSVALDEHGAQLGLRGAF